MVSEFVFSILYVLVLANIRVILFTCLLDLTTSDLHPAITLTTTVHSLHIREWHI